MHFNTQYVHAKLPCGNVDLGGGAGGRGRSDGESYSEIGEKLPNIKIDVIMILPPKK